MLKLLLIVALPFSLLRAQDASLPNLILIFCDDLGYGDLGVYGSELHRTPNIDKMASEGRVFTDFYSTSGVCTPSRSSLMTSCYPRRVNMHQNAYPPENTVMRQVLFPVAHRGLHPGEVTIAEQLKQVSYATACIGKWHLGDQLEFLPTRQGFDYYYGIPYSNDMGTKQFPINPPLPLMRNEEVIEAPVQQETLTQRYTAEAVSFIESHQNEHFFLYLPHTMPRNPVHASKDFAGKSKNNRYGDAIEEIDWSTGVILDRLRSLQLDDKTLVIFTSDNGASSAWGGSNLPLSGFKGSVNEGGMRIPMIAWWPGRVPAKTRNAALCTTMDLFPTFSELAGVEVSEERPIDGKSISSLLLQDHDRSPHQVFFFYQMDQLQAVRSGKWKLYLPLDERMIRFWDDEMETNIPAELYDLEDDIGENINLANERPEVVGRLTDLANQARKDLGDRNRPGLGQRSAGLVENPTPRVQ